MNGLWKGGEGWPDLGKCNELFGICKEQSNFGWAERLTTSKEGLGLTKLIRVCVLCYMQRSPQIVRGPVWMEERLKNATSSLF